MNFVSLASSSRGNCYVVDDGYTKIMLEAGLSEKEIKKRMQNAALGKLADIDAVLITHEHKDHSRAAVRLLNNGMTVYASEGTAEKIGDGRFEIVKHGDVFYAGSFEIMPFNTYHNTAEPLGFLLRSNKTNERILFAVDTVNMPYIIPGLDYIAIECNYCIDVLNRHTNCHEKVRKHIENTHFELGALVKYLHKLDMSNVKKIYLLHLSDSNSNEAMILQTFGRHFPGLAVEICAA